MNTPPADTRDLQSGRQGNSGVVLLQPRSLDAEYEWLGYEAAHLAQGLPNDWPAGTALRSD